eukprot:PhM_4_TR17389/c3_g3_i8/m.33003
MFVGRCAIRIALIAFIISAAIISCLLYSPANLIHEPEPLSSTKTTISTGSQTAAQSSDTPFVFDTTTDTSPDGDVLAVVNDTEERRRGVLYTTSAYSKPVRIEYNMSVDIEHTCEDTPCPFARPIQVLRTDSVAWRRDTPLCKKSDEIYRETRPGTWYYDGGNNISSDDKYVMERPLVYVPSSGCRMRRPTGSEFADCLRARRGTVAFLGDSHLRDVLHEFLFKLNWRSTKLLAWNLFSRRKITLLYHDMLNVSRTVELLRQHSASITDVFLTLGIWPVARGALSMEQQYEVYYERLKRIMTALTWGRHRPPNITYMSLRHIYDRSGKDPGHDWVMWFYTLSQTGDRVAVHRKMQACVVERVMREFGVAYEVINFRHSMSNTTLGHALSTPDGHHYRIYGDIYRAMGDVFAHRLCYESSTDRDRMPTNESVGARCNIPRLCRRDNLHSRCIEVPKIVAPPACRALFPFVRQFTHKVKNPSKKTRKKLRAQVHSRSAILRTVRRKYLELAESEVTTSCVDMRDSKDKWY